MSFKVHVIHDLMYGFNEATDSADLELPDCDIVILNGHISRSAKRTMLYATELTTKYPNIQFVINFGWWEHYFMYLPKSEYEFEDGLAIRMKNSADWPKNLHWKDPRSTEGLTILLQTGQTIQVWPTFGFPKVKPTANWKNLWLYLNIASDTIKGWRNNKNELEEINKQLSFELYSQYPKWATPEWINERHEKEETNIRNFEVDAKHYQILVTHLSPLNDSRLEGIATSTYRIHWSNRLWVTTNLDKSVQFLGGKLYSNPGRGSIARGKVLEVDVV